MLPVGLIHFWLLRWDVFSCASNAVFWLEIVQSIATIMRMFCAQFVTLILKIGVMHPVNLDVLLKHGLIQKLLQKMIDSEKEIKPMLSEISNQFLIVLFKMHESVHAL